MCLTAGSMKTQLSSWNNYFQLCYVSICSPTSAPGLQLLLHQLFGRGKLTVLHFGHDVVGTDGADDFRLLLVAVLRLDVDPGDFPERRAAAERSTAKPRATGVPLNSCKPFELVDEERHQSNEDNGEQHQHGRAAVDGVRIHQWS